MQERLIALATNLAELNAKWTPLPWQIKFVRALFYEGKTELGAMCGRGAGKSEVTAYCLWRWAMEHPNSENYFIGPLYNQMKEIMWASGRIQLFGPQEWIQSINNTELRITFKNGSFIKLEGANNSEKLRGIKPKGLICWDESKDIAKEAVEAMDPNRARYNAPMIYIGTPPDTHSYFIERMEMMKKDPVNCFFIQVPSSENHYNDKQWLERKKAQLLDAGLEDVYRREYLAEIVLGGNRSIFPMAAKMPVHKLDEVWPKDSYKWDLYVGFDPASSSVFAAVFFLMNPYNKQMITCGEIYADKPQDMTVRAIYAKAKEIIAELRKRGFRDLHMTYDSAARWFANELTEVDESFWVTPCDKSGGLQGEISCIRGVCAHGLVTFTDATPKLKWELDNYIKDDKGRIKDENDHAWQAWAYALKLAGFDYTDTLEPKTNHLEEERRGFKLEEDFAEFGEVEI